MNDNLKDIFSNLQQKKQRHVDEEILMIDSMNTFLRSYSMVKTLTPEGNHVGGLLGYLKSVGYAIKMYKPTRVILIFDGIANSTNKKYLYPQYKANRDYSKITHTHLFERKEDEQASMSNQITRLIDYIKCLPVHVVSIPKIEADDSIGYLVKKYESNENTKVITIMSADRDFLQLASEKTQIYSPTKKKTYRKHNVSDEFIVHVNNYINYKVLLGDSGDNVPGIRGLGPKKLIKLFPELLEESKLSLNDIHDKSLKCIEDNVLYKRVVENKAQLNINYRLMSLHDLLVPDDDIEEIERILSVDPPPLNIPKFVNMTLNDNLNDNTNWFGWLSEIFGSLNKI